MARVAPAIPTIVAIADLRVTVNALPTTQILPILALGAFSKLVAINATRSIIVAGAAALLSCMEVHVTLAPSAG